MDTYFLTWTQLGPNNSSTILLSRSTNGGVTWSAPVLVSDPNDDGYVWGSTVSVAPNGEVFVAYHSQPTYTTFDGGIVPDGSGQTAVVGYSNNLSTTLLPETVAIANSDVTSNIQGSGRTISGMTFLTQGSWTPYVLADPARPGDVYVVAANDPNAGVSGNVDNSDIVLAASTNYGQTWSSPTTVESAGNQPGAAISYSDQLFPTATIDANGDILLSWYSNQRGLTDAQNDYELDTYAAYSTDGAQTWSAPFLADNSQAFDPNPGAATVYNNATTSIGNSFGVALADGNAYVAYVGNTFTGATPTGQQVVFNSFGLSGTLIIDGTDASSTIHIVRMSASSNIDEVFLNNTLIFDGPLTSISGGIQIVRGQDVDSDAYGAPTLPVDSVTVFLDYSNGDPVPAGGVQFFGADDETNTIEVNAPGTYTLSDTGLTITTASATDTVMLNEVDFANLTSTVSNSNFTLSNWSGTATLTGTGPAANNTVIVAAGTVSASQLNLTDIGNLQITGGTFQVNTNFTIAALQVQSGGTLALESGTTLTANVTNSGVLDPLGAATIFGNYIQTLTGTLNIEIGGTTPGPDTQPGYYDQLNITGNVTLAGTLNVTLINGWTPNNGDVYQILTWSGSESGNFNFENFPSLNGGLIWQPVFESNSLNLDVGP